MPSRACGYCGRPLPADAPAAVRYCQDVRIVGARDRSRCQTKAADQRRARRVTAAKRGALIHPDQQAIA